jgi:subtilisin family serine protease
MLLGAFKLAASFNNFKNNPLNFAYSQGIYDDNEYGMTTQDNLVKSLYVPDEILVKFRKETADKLEQGLQSGIPIDRISMDDSFSKLRNEFYVYLLTPVFKDFKKYRAESERIIQKNGLRLSQSERHILNRRNRAPKEARIPELDRIYKIKLQLQPNQTLEQVVKAFNQSPQVEYAELNYVVTIDLTPNDSYFSYQWPLNNIGQIYPASGKYNNPPGIPDADIDAPQAWDVNTGSPDIIVAIADTGVDYNHRDINDNMWTDANGYHGYDFVNSDNYPMDDHGHGTHCAGIIAAKGNNGLDIAGVCWNAKIIALKFLDSSGSGSYANAANAFYYAVNKGADIISNSWGKNDFSQTMQDAINYAYSQGVIVVAAAGNDNQYCFPHYPASMEHVISVASTNSKDEKASSSNYGQGGSVDISAPGVDILSLRANGTSMGTVYDSYTTIASGTSMACPHVAGVLGLLLSKYPSLSTDEIVDRLLETTDDISGQNPDYKGLLGSGRVNAHKAIRDNFEGLIMLDRGYYSCSDEIKIEVRDFDVRTTGSQQVTLTTGDGDSETVTLLEDSNRPWIFAGTISTSGGPIVIGDGFLQVSHGQIITAVYNDPNYGDAGPSPVQTTAIADCEEALIFDVTVHDITSSGAKVRFRTNEQTTGRVRCGLICGGPYNIIGEDEELGMVHDIYLSGLNSQTDYYLVIDANDVSGNQATSTNSGQCYTFSTTASPEGLYVPAEYLTIQAAVDAAVNGNTIWVADGIYTGNGNRDIKFNGKAITVRSENGSDECIIDCGRICRAFTFLNSGENSNAIVKGFTIRNGYAGGSIWNDQCGGAIMCYNASPTISDCVFTNNQAIHYGGAIVLGDLSPVSNSVINNCTFLDNSSEFGGGIHNGKGNQVITNCTFKGNLATYDYGGGICCWQDSHATIENCLFKNNASWNNNRGGAIGCMAAYPLIKKCLFIDNFAMGNYYGGGGIYANHTNATIKNCTFCGNSTTQNGGACYFGGNQNIYVSNSILFNNYPNQIYNNMTTGRIYVSYSDVQGGGYSGTGNINSDPCFADPLNKDFHLKSQAGRWNPGSQTWVHDSISSPCIDSGNPSSDWTGELWPHGKRINMGRYGGTSEASMSNSTLGNIADLNNNSQVNYVDLMKFADKWLYQQVLLPEDLDRNGTVNFIDFAIFADNWFWQE